jgi:hypothetical protein
VGRVRNRGDECKDGRTSSHSDRLGNEVISWQSIHDYYLTNVPPPSNEMPLVSNAVLQAYPISTYICSAMFHRILLIMHLQMVGYIALDMPPEICCQGLTFVRTLRVAKVPSKDDYGETPISYPISTSVVLPSHPRFPAADNIYLQVGSTCKALITPALGGPGTMRKGTVECLLVCGALRSYRRKISCEALNKSVYSPSRDR